MDFRNQQLPIIHTVKGMSTGIVSTLSPFYRGSKQRFSYQTNEVKFHVCQEVFRRSGWESNPQTQRATTGSNRADVPMSTTPHAHGPVSVEHLASRHNMWLPSPFRESNSALSFTRAVHHHNA